MLSSRETSAGDIAARFPVSGPAISRHLRVLRECGFVQVRREGQRWMYDLDPSPLQTADQWMQTHLARWRARFDALGAHLDDMAVREASGGDAARGEKE